jgi:hypothetical protein
MLFPEEIVLGNIISSRDDLKNELFAGVIPIADLRLQYTPLLKIGEEKVIRKNRILALLDIMIEI